MISCAQAITGHTRMEFKTSHSRSSWRFFPLLVFLSIFCQCKGQYIDEELNLPQDQAYYKPINNNNPFLSNNQVPTTTFKSVIQNLTPVQNTNVNQIDFGTNLIDNGLFSNQISPTITDQDDDDDPLTDQIDLGLVNVPASGAVDPDPGFNDYVDLTQPVGEDIPPDESNQRCYVQTCDQTITGRNLLYSRALEIVQDEEYLTAADLDIIRRHRVKRQTMFTNTSSLQEICNFLDSLDNWRDLVRQGCNAACSSGCTGYNLYSGQTMSASNAEECASITIGFFERECGFGIYGILETLAAAAPVAAAGVGVAAVSSLASAPAETALVNSANVPPGNPAPGAIGGGASPVGASASVLALVPAGLIAVAVFPPYARPRTFPADSVIFLENPNVELLHKRRRKRSVLRYISRLFHRFIGRPQRRSDYYQHSSYNRPAYGGGGYYPQQSNWFDDIKSGTYEILDKAKNFLKKIKHNVQCLQTRLMMLGQKKRMKMLRMQSYHDSFYRNRRFFKEEKEEKYNEVVNSLDDCMEGIEEPLYGFRSRVTLIDRQPCILGVTCKSPGIQAQNRQAGEEFVSDAPPDCRVDFDPISSGCEQSQRLFNVLKKRQGQYDNFEDWFLDKFKT